jgi:hypothetical protein
VLGRPKARALKGRRIDVLTRRKQEQVVDEGTLFACCLTQALSYVEEMEVHFTTDQEAQLAQLATKAGTDADYLVKAAALRLLEDETYFHVPPPELPVLHLGAMKSLHRREIYDDDIR